MDTDRSSLTMHIIETHSVKKILTGYQNIFKMFNVYFVHFITNEQTRFNNC